eukprot:5893966-Pleurochrysis_carterae.AAC.1
MDFNSYPNTTLRPPFTKEQHLSHKQATKSYCHSAQESGRQAQQKTKRMVRPLDLEHNLRRKGAKEKGGIEQCQQAE